MDELLPKALPVDGGVIDIAEPKWDLPAQSAASYLKMVRHEASKCPDIMTASNLIAKPACSPQTYFISSDGPVKAPKELQPTIQWQIKQILEFSKLREKISKLKEKYEKPKEKGFSFPPDITDRQRWLVWTCGKEILKSTGGSFDDDDGDDDEEDDDDDEEDGKSNRSSEERTVTTDGVASILQQNSDDFSTAPLSADSASEKLELQNGNPPLISVIMHLSQSMIETLLKHHCTHLNEKGFHVQQGPWIYALLSLLEKPLSPDTCSTLRDLARVCGRLRARLDSPSHPHLTPLNLFISIVARYFDQRDLADGHEPSS